MEIRGLSNGLGLFYVEVRIHYTTKDGYEGTRSFPTMYVVGGNATDAMKNAIKIVNPRGHMVDGDTFRYWTAYAVNADPNSAYQGFTDRGTE